LRQRLYFTSIIEINWYLKITEPFTQNTFPSISLELLVPFKHLLLLKLGFDIHRTRQYVCVSAIMSPSFTHLWTDF
jgi:hypothetical protein